MPMLMLASIVAGASPDSDPVTFSDLLRQMADLRTLAEFPDPAYKTIQFSSYDRRSVAAYAPGWYANSDGFGREPIPNVLATLEEPDADGVGTYLIADVDGPGALVRTWTAAMDGEVTVTLDGRPDPLFLGSARGFLGRTYSVLARKAGLIEDDAAPGFRQEEACYFPIPFAKGLRIEWRGRLAKLHFYHIEVRRYPAGTAVRTFELGDLTTHRYGIARALAVLRAPSAAHELPPGGRVLPLEASVAPGQRVELAALEGPAALHELRLKVDAEDTDRALRQTVLRVHFDGASQPQIEAPVGDFFGSGPGVSPYDSLPMTVAPDGTMTCRFVMPFGSAARLVLENHGGQSVRVTGRAALADYEWREGDSLHFHAKWRVDHGLVAGGGDDSFDVPYVCARGRGVLVGVAAMLLNPSSVPTSGGNWWGEGDEKIWVDDDAFPSVFGTGSEDYFNYAWSRPGLFEHAYCAQPLNTGPGNRGFVTNNRWHILDPLPFRSRIDFFMELMHHSRTPGFTYARLACFYAGPQVRDDHIPITTADVTQGLQLPADWRPVAAGQARDAVFYQAQDLRRGDSANVAVVRGPVWSAGKLLNWTPKAEGETLDLRFDVARAGSYRMAITAGLTPVSGRFSAAIDGGAQMSPVPDLFTPQHTMLRSFFLQVGKERVLELTEGEHTLTLTARGNHEGSSGTAVGLDFVWLVPGK